MEKKKEKGWDDRKEERKEKRGAKEVCLPKIRKQNRERWRKKKSRGSCSDDGKDERKRKIETPRLSRARSIRHSLS